MRVQARTMHVVSSITITAPEPRPDPAFWIASKSMVMPIMVSPDSTGIDEPPGITAFSLWPLRTPPAISSNSGNGVPSGISKLPGLLTWPVTEKIFGPPLLGLPRFRNQSAPLRRIAGADAKVSVLLIVVGRPYRPKPAGNGGLKR